MRKPRVLRILAIAGFAMTVAAEPAPAQADRWSVVKGVMARVEVPGAIRAVGLVCRGPSPVLALRLAQMIRPVNAVSFGVGGAPVTLALRRQGATDTWFAPLTDTRLIEALRSESAVLSMAVAGGPTARFNLAGAREAIDQALQSCHRPTATVAGGAPGATSRTVAAALASGLYVVDGSGGTRCRDLTWQSFYDYAPGDPDTVIFVEGRPAFPHRTLSPTSFSVKNDPVVGPGETRYRLCPEAEVPENARRFSKSAQKRLPALPIKPGVYRAHDAFTGKPFTGADCAQMSGCYWLFEPSRYAHRGEEAGSWWTERVSGVVQVGPRVYETASPPGDPGQPFFIEAPDRITTTAGEQGTLLFLPVDPARVPAAQRPRFSR